MTSDLLVKALPWGIATVMAGVAYFCLDLYQDERDEFVAFRAKVEAIADAQKEQIEREKQQHEENLRQVRKDYEDKLPSIRDDAVRTYRMRYPDAGSCPVPGDGPSVPLDDGTATKCVADEFVRDAAEDAAKLGAFQDWCKRNNCPIKD